MRGIKNGPETGNESQCEENVLRDFAQKHNVSRTAFSRDECGDLILQGKNAHIYTFSEIRLGICLEYDSAKRWNGAKRAMQEAGFRMTQDAEREGCGLFDPTSREQVRLALKLAGVREKRKLTPELLERLKRTAFKPRQHAQEGHLAA
jgi:hypothetical protein